MALVSIFVGVNSVNKYNNPGALISNLTHPYPNPLLLCYSMTRGLDYFDKKRGNICLITSQYDHADTFRVFFKIVFYNLCSDILSSKTGKPTFLVTTIVQKVTCTIGSLQYAEEKKI